jgi:C_GCAxxG_C_C family probable redox protein
MTDVERAVEFFKNGCACSQAVLGAYGPRFGMEESLAVRVAAGFAGGMRMAETCGAVTGAIMVLGLAHCTDSCRTGEERAKAYAAVTEFTRRFGEAHGSLLCRELLGCDISTEEGHKTAQEKDLFRTRCPELVRGAARLVEATAQLQ